MHREHVPRVPGHPRVDARHSQESIPRIRQKSIPTTTQVVDGSNCRSLLLVEESRVMIMLYKGIGGSMDFALWDLARRAILGFVLY